MPLGLPVPVESMNGPERCLPDDFGKKIMNDWIKNHVQLIAFGASGCGVISTFFHHAVGWAASYAGVVHAKVSPHQHRFALGMTGASCCLCLLNAQ
jgi:hypothetical protein